MIDINTQFNRTLLAEVMKEVREHTTVAERKAACGYKYSCLNNQGEFIGPERFYWHGSASSITEAKINGWNAWLDKFHRPDTEKSNG